MASIEPAEKQRGRTKSNNVVREFTRSLAPSPPTQDERMRYELEKEVQAKPRFEIARYPNGEIREPT
jgi:hypothetical protein